MRTGKNKKDKKSLCIIGANLKGAALFYLATRYGNFDEITLIDKKASEHILADKKFKRTFPAYTEFTTSTEFGLKDSLNMMANYAESYQLDCFRKSENLLLAFNENEVLQLQQKYHSLTRSHNINWWDSKALFKYEPNVLKGRYITKDSIAAIHTKTPYGFIDTSTLGNHLINSALKLSNRAKTIFSHDILAIRENNSQIILEGFSENLHATSCVMTGKKGAIYFAKQLGLETPFYYQRLWQQAVEIEKLTNHNILFMHKHSLCNEAQIQVIPEDLSHNLVHTGMSLKAPTAPSLPLISSVLNKNSPFRTLFPKLKSLKEKEAFINHTFFNISALDKLFSKQYIQKVYPLASLKSLPTSQRYAEEMLLIDSEKNEIKNNNQSVSISNKIHITLSTQNDDFLAFQSAIALLEKASKSETIPIHYEALYRDLNG